MTKNSDPLKFKDWQSDVVQKLEKLLSMHLPMEDKYPSQLHEAMAYSVLNGGKRLRPCLTIATGELLNLKENILLGLAEIVEILHVYSLVHDDLPAMDNDDLRRGKASCHIAYNEETAILVGDALQSLAYQWLSELDLPSELIVKQCTYLARSTGSLGMAQGQSLDMQWSRIEQQKVSIDTVKRIHKYKTGKLFDACIALPLIAAGQFQENHPLLEFSKNLGIAFQIQDDILDIVGNEAELGKPVTSDIEENKLTYPSVIGIEESQKQKNEHFQKALNSLTAIKAEKSRLYELTKAIIVKN